MNMNAFDILSWLPSACADLADGIGTDAEELFEDFETIKQLISDHTYHQNNVKEVWMELWNISDGIIREAARQLLYQRYNLDPKKETIVKLNNWKVTAKYDAYTPPELISCKLSGKAYGHPKFYDGQEIITSQIVDAKGRKVYTRNTTYVLGKINKSYRKWLKEIRPEWNWRNPITIKRR